MRFMSKSFPTPGDLKSHKYVHNGSWPYRCSVCLRGFSKQTNLNNHIVIHSGDKRHMCNLCGKRFAMSCNLKAHLKVHKEQDGDYFASMTFPVNSEMLPQMSTYPRDLGGEVMRRNFFSNYLNFKDLTIPFQQKFVIHL
ncbi:pr domain zinc finger protein [Holotrichia oblita]|uniref:Pr domain zinc finger protein n=1 Tax=Holotrichia oblita TaxID=644536 RepID=A0ACB9THB2_HOLOL|nr:pr domain zinc finger protein [Holotrichia oblita]